MDYQDQTVKDVVFDVETRLLLQRQDTLNDILEIIRDDSNGLLKSPVIDDETSIDVQPILKFLRGDSNHIGKPSSINHDFASLDVSPDEANIDGNQVDMQELDVRSPSMIIHHFPVLTVNSPRSDRCHSATSSKSTLSIKSNKIDDTEYRSKRIKNNIAVRKCRAKKKEDFQSMRIKTHQLEEENERLRKYLNELQRNVGSIKGKNAQLELKFKEICKNRK